MNKKLSLILLFLLFISLFSVLLAFMAFSNGGKGGDVSGLKSGYQQLEKQVKELKATTDDLSSKINNQQSSKPTTPTIQPSPPNVQNPPQSPAPNPPAQTTQQTKTINGNKVNMRSGDATNAKVVRQLTSGETVTLTGQTSTSGGLHWVQIKDSQGNTGWVAADFVK